MNNFTNDQNIGKPIVSILDSKSLFSANSTFYDKWNIFRFIMTNPEESELLSVELRKYRVKENGEKEYCDERTSYSLSKKDPEVAKAIDSLVMLAIQKGVELNHFRH